MTGELANAFLAPPGPESHVADAIEGVVAGLGPPVDGHLLDDLGVAVYLTDPLGRITYYNEAAATFWGRRPELGELWCGSWKLFWADGRPMAHADCPMAITLRTGIAVRGYQAIAERPDGTRAAFVPYPSVIRDPNGTVTGAVNVLVDTTEQRRAEEALGAASAVKDEFLGLVSHELRTPVTTIFGNARLLRDRSGISSQHAAMIDDIATDAERLLSVVDNLLLLARTAPADLDSEPQALVHVVRRIVDSFTRKHPDRPVEVMTGDESLIVEADLSYLEVLVGNLVSNAHKYSPASAPIEVEIRPDGSEVLVVVRDRGIGIDADEAEQLFTIFYRSEAAKRVSSGLGIGLSACARVVDVLGGRIWGYPRDGGGAEFGFALPLRSDLAD